MSMGKRQTITMHEKLTILWEQSRKGIIRSFIIFKRDRLQETSKKRLFRYRAITRKVWEIKKIYFTQNYAISKIALKKVFHKRYDRSKLLLRPNVMPCSDNRISLFQNFTCWNLIGLGWCSRDANFHRSNCACVPKKTCFFPSMMESRRSGIGSGCSLWNLRIETTDLE